MEPLPIVSDVYSVQEFYIKCRLAGESHNIAEMLALQQTPQPRTDSTFLEGRCNGNQFEDCPELGDYYKGIAEAHGRTVDRGDIYLSQLANFPGDPEAWVSGRGDVERVLEKRGWGAEGSVNMKAREAQGRPSVDVDAGIVEQAMLDRMDADPDFEASLTSPAKVEEAFQATKEQIKPHWSAESTSTSADLAAA